MTDSKAMMAMFDAFDNANQGLAIWDVCLVNLRSE